jgi:hypothetical protein
VIFTAEAAVTQGDTIPDEGGNQLEGAIVSGGIAIDHNVIGALADSARYFGAKVTRWGAIVVAIDDVGGVFFLVAVAIKFGLHLSFGATKILGKLNDCVVSCNSKIVAGWW